MALDAGMAKLLSSAESAGVIAALEAEFGEMVFWWPTGGWCRRTFTIRGFAVTGNANPLEIASGPT